MGSDGPLELVVESPSAPLRAAAISRRASSRHAQKLHLPPCSPRSRSMNVVWSSRPRQRFAPQHCSDDVVVGRRLAASKNVLGAGPVQDRQRQRGSFLARSSGLLDGAVEGGAPPATMSNHHQLGSDEVRQLDQETQRRAQLELSTTIVAARSCAAACASDGSAARNALKSTTDRLRVNASHRSDCDSARRPSISSARMRGSSAPHSDAWVSASSTTRASASGSPDRAARSTRGGVAIPRCVDRGPGAHDSRRPVGWGAEKSRSRPGSIMQRVEHVDHCQFESAGLD